MDRFISSASITQATSEHRLAALKAKYPKFEFKARLEDRRYKFYIVNMNPNTPVPLLESISRTASGLDPVLDAKETEEVVIGK